MNPTRAKQMVVVDSFRTVMLRLDLEQADIFSLFDPFRDIPQYIDRVMANKPSVPVTVHELLTTHSKGRSIWIGTLDAFLNTLCDIEIITHQQNLNVGSSHLEEFIDRRIQDAENFHTY